MGAQRYGVAVLALLFVTLIYSVMDAQKRSAMLIVSPGMVDPIADKGGCSVSPNALLRIVPMGDSITEGSGSSDYNGYRLPLHDLLMANCSGRTVEYIGEHNNIRTISLSNIPPKAPNCPALLHQVAPSAASKRPKATAATQPTTSSPKTKAT